MLVLEISLWELAIEDVTHAPGQYSPNAVHGVFSFVLRFVNC